MVRFVDDGEQKFRWAFLHQLMQKFRLPQDSMTGHDDERLTLFDSVERLPQLGSIIRFVTD